MRPLIMIVTMALRPLVSASHGTVKSTVLVTKKLELGSALSVRAIMDMASDSKPSGHSTWRLKIGITYRP